MRRSPGSFRLLKKLQPSGKWIKPIHKDWPKPIALRERRKHLKRDIIQSEFLGKTPDGMHIYLSQPAMRSSLMREIGRLRELAFRAIGEGTGRIRDLDKHDEYYLHLVLWDAQQQEIAGAYRMADTRWVLKQKRELYSASLFNFSTSMETCLDSGLELGRSFVQPRYQGTRSLDYLWYGIGAFLSKYPDYRYLFGPVSISSTLPKSLADMLVYFYSLYFPKTGIGATSYNPYRLSESNILEMREIFSGIDYKSDFALMKCEFAKSGEKIPTLYKQYSQLAKPGGIEFLDFGIDPEFANCIDGLVLFDLTKIKDKKRRRYLESGNYLDRSITLRKSA